MDPLGLDSNISPGERGRRDVEVRLRALALLFLAGASIGLVSLALPHSPRADDGALLVNIATAFAGAAAIALTTRRLPGWAVHAYLAAGTLLVTRAIFYSGDGASYYAIWYVWVALYASCFLTRSQTAAHLALVGVSYAAVLATAPDPSRAARWLTTVCTLLIAAVFVDMLVRQLRRHARRSDENARRLAVVAAAAERMSQCASRVRLGALLVEAALATGAKEAAIWDLSAAPELLARAGRHPARGGTAGRPAASPPPPDGRVWERLAASEWLSLSLPAGPDDALSARQVLAKAYAGGLERLELVRRLTEVARTDELCGLPNRRAWEQELPLQLARSRRFRYPVCVVLLDLDGLKRLNDSAGHQAGDEILRETARLWLGEVRDIDILVRWGGDEFALILPDCPLADAVPVAERIRETTPAAITCSAGLAEWDGVETHLSLVARADRALYEAKAGGRDRLVSGGSSAVA